MALIEHAVRAIVMLWAGLVALWTIAIVIYFFRPHKKSTEGVREMQYQLTIRCTLEGRDEHSQYHGGGTLQAEETIQLGALNLGDVADVLNGFHELGQVMKESQAQREAKKAKAEAD